MTTRVVATESARKTTAKTDRDITTTVHYLVCDDPKNHSPFVNPRAEKRVSTDAQNTGKSSSSRPWPSRSTTPSWILNAVVLFDTFFVSWWLMHVLNVYREKIPLAVKRKITFVAWDWYVWIHNLVVCKWMGGYADLSFYTGQAAKSITDDMVKNDDVKLSDEFKALSSLMYPVQFYPIPVPLMRFSLSQLNSVSWKEVPLEDNIDRVNCDEKDNDDNFVAPESHRDQQKVSGLYISNSNKNESTNKNFPKKILFWIYGGAYLAGDAEGNLSLANEFVEDCDADAVFIPSYRLAPEVGIDDVLWDICWSYRYLLRKLQEERHDQGYEIVMVGISSGGALVLRLLQFLRDRSFQLPMMPSFLEPLVDDIIEISNTSSTRIAGSVLYAPYVDYREPQPPRGSFLQNAKYDWVVTEAVQHYGLPYLNGFIPPLGEDLQSGKNTNGRIQYSPLCHDMNDLPPLCLIASEHEACYDMTIEIVNKARRKPSGNADSGENSTDVTIGIWKHMCHVFSMMQALLPEGKASIEFSKEWIRTKTTNHHKSL